jgi:hypothetical protein
MDILITGMTSSQTREGDTIAGYAASALRESGHDVTVAKPSLADALDNRQWDHVFCGLGPLHGLGTSSMYGALGVIGTHWSDRLTLFLDDTDSSKIGSGLRIMRRKPERLIKPFYVYKREHEIAVEPKVHSWLMTVVDAILESTVDFPALMLPAFTFENAYAVAAKITPMAMARVVPVDFSTYVPKLVDVIPSPVAPDELHDTSFWAVESNPLAPEVRALGHLAWPTVQVKSSNLHHLPHASGYLAPWEIWSPRFKQMTEEGIPVATVWRVFKDVIGDAWETLATTIETMPLGEREILASAQHQQFIEFIQPPSMVAHLINGTIGRST